jgi:hypothetical protein
MAEGEENVTIVVTFIEWVLEPREGSLPSRQLCGRTQQKYWLELGCLGMPFYLYNMKKEKQVTQQHT